MASGSLSDGNASPNASQRGKRAKKLEISISVGSTVVYAKVKRPESNQQSVLSKLRSVVVSIITVIPASPGEVQDNPLIPTTLIPKYRFVLVALFSSF